MGGNWWELPGVALAVIVYLPTLFWHKIGVFLAGVTLNRRLAPTGLRVPYHRLIFHDWVKMTPAELVPYARHFYSSNLQANLVGRLVSSSPLPRWAGVVDRDDRGFQAAVQHHVNRMDHHLQYYFGPDLGLWKRRGVVPDAAVIEMVADRMAASWGYDGKWPPRGRWDRLQSSFDKDTFPTPRSKALFFAVCCAQGYEPSLAGSEYSWDDVETALGSTLTSDLRKISKRI